MSRLLTPEEIAALRAEEPLFPAPRERCRVVVEAGRTELTPGEVAALRPGDVLPLTSAAHGPVEVVANAVVIAYGELIDQGGRAAVRIVSLAPSTGSSRRTPR